MLTLKLCAMNRKREIEMVVIYFSGSTHFFGVLLGHTWQDPGATSSIVLGGHPWQCWRNMWCSRSIEGFTHVKHVLQSLELYL